MDRAKLPPGWSFKEIGGIGTDRYANRTFFPSGTAYGLARLANTVCASQTGTPMRTRGEPL